jgi:SAM-dependent methyltransferase
MNVKFFLKSICLKIYKYVIASSRGRLFVLSLKTFLSTRGMYVPFFDSPHKTKRRWEQQGYDSRFPNPEIYLKEDRSIEELFKDVLPCLDFQSSVLEIGCNAGRSLNYLYKKGYKNLTGVEIGIKAIELMKVAFPETYAKCRILIGDAPEVLKGLASNSYDLVFTHSVLVNIHPKYNTLFEHMARISKKYILTLENEGSYLIYPRDFKKIFETFHYKMIVSKIFVNRPLNSYTLPDVFTANDILGNNTIRLFVKDCSNSF